MRSRLKATVAKKPGSRHTDHRRQATCHGDGSSSRYANLADTVPVNVGDWLECGAAIGTVGTSALCEIGQGAHLHFALYVNGQSVDPLEYLPA